MSGLTVFKFNERSIRFENRGERVWVSLTDMAKASGKLVGHWQALRATAEFLEEFSGSIGMTIDQIIQSNESKGTNETRGTWAIEEVAIDFAAWCNVKFRVWVTQQIKTLMTTGKVELEQPVQPRLTLEQAESFIVRFESVHALATRTGNVRLQQQMETAIAQYTDVYLLAGLPQQPMLNSAAAQTGAIRYEGIVDVAIRLGCKVPSNFESALGNYAGKRIPHLRISIDAEELKDYRTSAASGKRLAAYMYPAFNAEVEACVNQYCDLKGFAAQA